MSFSISRFPRATPITLASIFVVGLSAALALPGHADSSGLSCEVVLSDLGGLVEIAAYVETDETAYGTYKMDIRQGRAGNTIQQSGDFEALSGLRTELSQAVLSGNARDYDVKLSVSTNGKRQVCPTGDSQG